MPSLTYGCFDYVTTQNDIEYARQFSDILRKDIHSAEDYDPEDYLTEREKFMREIYDKHCLYAACKGQGGDEWRVMRAFTFTSTSCHAILPRSDEDLNDSEYSLLKDDLGLSIKSSEDVELDISWMEKSDAELRQLSNERLKEICKSYGRTFSNKRKDELIKTVKEGPVTSQSITEIEKILKYSFLQPLPQDDRSAHRFGSLNEERVRSAIQAIVSKLGWVLVDMFECGLLRNKWKEYLATSLDGWLIIKYDLSEELSSSKSDISDDEGTLMERRHYNCGLEIKTPSSKKILQNQVRQGIELYGTFSHCEFGSSAFKQLVYKPEYRVQVFHHALVANLKYVLFVVAGATRVHYAVLIWFPENKISVMKGLLARIYTRSLKWAYHTPGEPADLMSSIPDFREDVVSSKSYPITKENILFNWIIWRKLMSMVRTTKLPLPKAHKLIPEIVARWNRSKGRIDEMTRYLDGMGFPFPKGTPKQQLVMREFKKMAVNVSFILKHCFSSKPPPVGKGYAAVQYHIKKMNVTMKDVLFELTTGYRIMNPIRGLLPGSPSVTAACGSPYAGTSSVSAALRAIDEDIENSNSEWQKKAAKYVKERITPESRYKLKKFIDDDTLNKIRLDRTLFHIPKSQGSYIDSRTGRATTIGGKAKEKVHNEEAEQAKDSDNSPDKIVKKVRKCPPKCVVCCAIADPQDKEFKITQTTIHCSTCLVTLCLKKKGNRRTSCFEIFHQISDLSKLKGTPDSSSPAEMNTGSSKKRKASSKEARS
jgi:hypothetical protein